MPSGSTDARREGGGSGHDRGIDRLICIYGRGRSGTSSIADALNRSPVYCVWIGKQIWTRRPHASIEELAGAIARPGGTQHEMSRRYNEETVSTKDGWRILGDKVTGHRGTGRESVLELILHNIGTTARNLHLEHEVVVCVRDPRSWLAAWAMSHYVLEMQADEATWNGLMDDGEVRSRLEHEMESYRAHLERVLAHSRDPAVRVRSMERTRRAGLGYLFEFDEYIRRVAPAAYRQGDWPARLEEIKARLEERIRNGWLRTSTGERLYGEVQAAHRPYPVEQADGSVREV